MTSHFLLVVFGAAFIPLFVGFFWYNEKVFGTAWMKETGLTKEDGKKANMPLIFGLTFLFSIFLSFAISSIVIHQSALYSIFAELKGPEDQAYLAEFFKKYGTLYRTFKHGVFHGLLSSITIVLPLIGVNALFEGRSFKYIFINVGYWATCLMLMGGVICQFA